MMFNEEELNKVVLIGGDHHNGLALARIFGINGIKPYGIIVGECTGKGFVKKSKYWRKTWHVNNDKDAIYLVKNIFKYETKKPVIIPWSDGAAAELDNRINELKDRFIFPSINNNQGEIVRLMDKSIQVEFAKKYHIPMARTWVLHLSDVKIPKDLVYPCILKPVVSFEGNKLDIEKCGSRGEVLDCLNRLKENGYSRILLQEFLKFDYEILYEGCAGKEKSYFVSKNIRQWPEVGGVGSFDQCITEGFVHDMANKLFDVFEEIKFNGLFDIEMFVINNNIYLNEINWRNSGRDFMCLGTGVYYPLIWYYSNIDKDVSGLKHFCEDNSQIGMDEALDLRHVVYGKLSFKDWLRDRRRTGSFGLWYKHDLLPTFTRYVYLFIEMIKRGKNG